MLGPITAASRPPPIARAPAATMPARRPRHPACRIASAGSPPFARPTAIGRQSAVRRSIPCPGWSLQRPSQWSYTVPGVTTPRASARRTVAPCRCHAIVAPSRSTPTASQRRVRLATTFAGSSSVRMPRLSDANGPSETPPCRVENATAYGPGASQWINSSPPLTVSSLRPCGEDRAGAFGELVAVVQRRVVDHHVEELSQRAAELGARLEAEPDEVAAVEGEVGEAMRAPTLLLDQRAKAIDLRKLVLAYLLAEQVRAAVRCEVEGELVAVVPQEAARGGGVCRQVVGAERVLADDRDDAANELRGIPEAVQDVARDPRSFAGVAARVWLERLPEVVEERCEPHRERIARVRGRLNDGEQVLVERQVLAGALLLEPDCGRELGNQLRQDAGVAHEPERLAGTGAEEELRELTQAVGGEPAADPLAGDDAHTPRVLAQLSQRLVVRLEIELRDEPQAADEAERVLLEAPRRDGPQDSGTQVALAAEGIDELAGRESPRDRVDREVAAAHVVLHGERRVGDDLEVVAAGSRRALGARRRELDPRRRERADAPLPREEPDADDAVRDDERLDLAVRSQPPQELVLVETGNEEVRVLRRAPEQLVSDGAADEVGVEVEAADEVFDCRLHGRILARRRPCPVPPCPVPGTGHGSTGRGGCVDFVAEPCRLPQMRHFSGRNGHVRCQAPDMPRPD